VAHASKDPVPPSQRTDAEIPAGLEAIVLDCLVKDPADRIQSAEEIVKRLAQVEFVESWTPQRAESWWEGNP
jgi:serine/threonine-protein kinase